MFIIYSQDETYIIEHEDDFKSTLATVYGEKLGDEAYSMLRKAPIGASYRKFGGPLVQVITEAQAKEIRRKETAIGLM